MAKIGEINLSTSGGKPLKTVYFKGFTENLRPFFKHVHHPGTEAIFTFWLM